LTPENSQMDAGCQNTDKQIATAIVRDNINPALTVIAIRPLHGGMINRVEEWQTDGNPPFIVAKISPQKDHRDFFDEFESLRWYRSHTSFLVPEPYSCVSGTKHFKGSCFLMQKVKGRNLGQAHLTQKGMRSFQEQLADVLIDLHSHTRQNYGSALQAEGKDRWLDIFAPQIESNFSEMKEHFDSHCRETVSRMLNHLDEWLPEFRRPTLVHGDIWATNIMVDDTNPNSPSITAFLDSHARFTEVEYELAYLRIFHTADDTFFKRYTLRYPLREGFERRCLVYWLNTMMLHVWLFGTSYLSACKKLVDEIAKY
jgi:fructosamine-3-kinase